MMLWPLELMWHVSRRRVLPYWPVCQLSAHAPWATMILRTDSYVWAVIASCTLWPRASRSFFHTGTPRGVDGMASSAGCHSPVNIGPFANSPRVPRGPRSCNRTSTFEPMITRCAPSSQGKGSTVSSGYLPWRRKAQSKRWFASFHPCQSVCQLFSWARWLSLCTRTAVFEHEIACCAAKAWTTGPDFSVRLASGVGGPGLGAGWQGDLTRADFQGAYRSRLQPRPHSSVHPATSLSRPSRAPG